MLASLNQWIRYRWSFFMRLWDIILFIILGWVVSRGISIAFDNSILLDDKQTLLAGFGGLVLSILALYITTIRPFFRKPRLELFIDGQWSEPHIENDTGSWFYRFRIENYGLNIAENCVGRLIGVWTTDGKQIMKFDPLSLYWARQGKIKEDDREIITFEPIDIQGYGDFYFLDLAQVKEKVLTLRVVIPPLLTLTREPDTSPSPGNMPILKLPGTYYVRVGVYAKDAYIRPTYLKISCTAITQPLDSTNSPCRIQKVRRLPRL